MVAVALPLDLSPARVEDVARNLPPQARATLDWFPEALRQTLVEPLRNASVGRWRQVLDAAAIESAHLFFRLGQSVALLLRDPTLERAIRSGAIDDSLDRRIAVRLEPIDRVASDELREATAWLRALLTALLDQVDLAASVPEQLPNDEELQRDLSGTGGSFLRGMLLTVASSEVVLDPRPIPPAIVEWSAVAFREISAAANAMRALGVAIPTEVTIPGYSTDEWRYRRRSSLLDALVPNRARVALPRGVIDRVVEVLHPQQVWLFGSRARGDHRPMSDWDLMAVLSDDATDEDIELSNVWLKLRDLRRMRVDVFPIRRRDFDEDRGTPGTLAAAVMREGKLLYGR